jgi:hypothetical protein
MSGFNTYTGPSRGFNGFAIEKDAIDLDYLRVKKYNQLPLVTSTQFPPPGQYGAIAYDVLTKKPYFSDGLSWLPIGLGVTPTAPVGSFSFIKNGLQSIPKNTLNVTITGWTITGSDVYHSIPGWDLLLGEYTAPKNEILSVSINIAWAASISNLGNRHLKVQHKKSGSLIWTTVKEVITQADADINVQTTQECQINAKLSTGDSARITVHHTANVPVSVDGGIFSSISGFLINT